MKRVFAAIAALTLALPAVAGEQDNNRDRREGRGGQRNEAPAQQAPAQQAPAPQQGGPRANGGFFGRVNPNEARQAPNTAQERGRGAPAQIAPSQQNPQPNVARERSRGGAPDRGAPNVAQVAPRQGGGQDGRNFTENRDNDRGRDFRNNDRGRDFRGDRDRGRSFNFRGREYAAVRAPAYRYPRGWGYRHWDRGEFLPSVFLATPFFFDYDLLGLPPPPPGTRWVRNGPDALLVNIYNDRIEDVIYDAFY